MRSKHMTRQQVDYFRTKKVTSSTGEIEPGFYRAFYPGYAGKYQDIYVLGLNEDDSRMFEYIRLNADPAGDDGRPGYHYISTCFSAGFGVIAEADGYRGNNFLVPMGDVRKAYVDKAWEKPQPQVHEKDIVSVEIIRSLEHEGDCFWCTASADEWHVHDSGGHRRQFRLLVSERNLNAGCNGRCWQTRVTYYFNGSILTVSSYVGDNK